MAVKATTRKVTSPSMCFCYTLEEYSHLTYERLFRIMSRFSLEGTSVFLASNVPPVVAISTEFSDPENMFAHIFT